MKIMSVTQGTHSLSSKTTITNSLSVLQNQISYYSIPFVDTSQISALNLGTNLVEYKVDTQLSNSVNNKKNTEDFFQCKIV